MQHPGLRIGVVVSPPLEENTYIAHLPDHAECLVFDPGFLPEKIFAYLDEQELVPAAILNTHGHHDHIAGNWALKQRWPECPLIIGREDASKLSDPQENLSLEYGVAITSPTADQLVAEGDTYRGAGLELTVREIGGHSVGHVVFIWQGRPPVVFGGDVLFAGGIGRTDFPDGSFPDLLQGIHQKLFTLPDDTIVLPGHGGPTTIGTEKRGNPFVGEPAGYCF